MAKSSIVHDKRFNRIGQIIAPTARELFFKKQQKLAEQIDKVLNDRGESFTYILRRPNEEEGPQLADLIIERLNPPTIIFITPTLINPQDIALLIPEQIMRLSGKIFLPNLGLETTLQSYIIYAVEQISKGLFENLKPGVIGVFNGTNQDVLDAIQYGGRNTVLVLTGHGNPDTFLTSDGTITFSSITTPNELLRAILKHACYKIHESNEGRLAEKIVSWDRATSPLDWAVNVLGES